LQSRHHLFLLLIFVLTGLSVWGYLGRDLNKGLDVVGGIRIVYQMETQELSEEQRDRLPQVQSRLQNILLNRVSGTLGVTEPIVQPKGTDQFIVEMPGFTDIEQARNVLSTTATVKMYHATNVSTALIGNRRYNVAGDETTETGAPFVTFMPRTGDAPIFPEDEEYQEMIEDWELLAEGEDLVDAQAEVVGQGFYRPSFRFGGEGAQNLEDWSRRFTNRQENLAFVLDDRVLSVAPLQQGAILRNGEAFIDGQFEPDYVRNLVELLRAGSLPVPLVELSSQEVSPTIGEQAFEMMVTAAGIAVALIAVFLAIYYAFPGFIAVISLGLYLLFTLTVMKWAGATFSLATVAAFVLSVGLAVDANVLVFERIKEELRADKKFASALNVGFKRAWAAILDGSISTIITSMVLYILGDGPVKGFATALIIGVLVSIFTAFFVTRSLLVSSAQLGWFADPKYYALGRHWFGERLEQGSGKKVLEVIGKWRRWFAISAIAIIPMVLFALIGGVKFNVEFLGGLEAAYALPEERQDITADEAREELEAAGIRAPLIKFGEVDETRIIYVALPQSTIDQLGASSAALPAGTLVAQAEDPVADTGTGVTEETTETDPATTEEAPATEQDDSPAVEEEATETAPEAPDAEEENVVDEEALGDLEDPRTELGIADRELNEQIATALGLTADDAVQFETVGPTISRELVRNAIYAVLISAALIVLYIGIRFGITLGGFKNGLKFGLAAIGALIHDILFVIGAAAVVGYLFGWAVSSLFITALLTVIGFSVNDTIVIFDRIRENLRKQIKGETMEHLVNRSITQSVARSINTSFTTMIPLIILVAFGTPTPELKFMCVAMLVGILTGTYSSIFFASPIVYLWDKKVMAKHGEQNGIMAEARREAKMRLTTPTMENPAVATGSAAATPGQPDHTSEEQYGTIKRRSGAGPTTRVRRDDDDDED
jgi:SecD/SecF fusion protein